MSASLIAAMTFRATSLGPIWENAPLFQDNVSMPSPSERTTLDFNCSLVSTTVQIQLDYIQNVSSTGKRMGRRLSGIACSGQSTCAVSCVVDGAPSSDWSQCAYLHPTGRRAQPDRP